jgi:molybdopterin synthase sulfur carrier subunit
MTISINYFGMLAEITRCESEQLDLSGTIADLKKLLLSKYPEFHQKDFRIAQNEELVEDQTLINGTLIAVLPPFAGG